VGATDRSGARRLGCLLLVTLAVAACGGGSSPRVGGSTTTALVSTTTTALVSSTTTATMVGPTTTTVLRTTTSTTAPPSDFASSVDHVTAADLGASWHDGCPDPPSQLRLVTVSLVGFDGSQGTGQVVVNASVASDVVGVFRQLYDAGFPVRKMKPIFTQAEYDDFETPDDNSTGFSCRDAVNDSGTSSWSMHAYGDAIDVNPIENPYIEGDKVIPSAGAAYTDRGDVRPGMAVPGSVIVQAFGSVGWGWGSTFQDYQHFSTNGR
jgi:hypothetical protein